jgi:hypothetical protein
MLRGLQYSKLPIIFRKKGKFPNTSHDETGKYTSIFFSFFVSCYHTTRHVTTHGVIPTEYVLILPRIKEGKSFLFYHCAVALSGPRPPHYREFIITFRYTTLSRTPLDEWTVCRTDLLSANTQHSQETHPCPQRNSNPQSQKVSGRRPTPLNHAATGFGQGKSRYRKV